MRELLLLQSHEIGLTIRARGHGGYYYDPDNYSANVSSVLPFLLICDGIFTVTVFFCCVAEKPGL